MSKGHRNMKTNRTLKRAIAGVLLTGGIAVGGLGLAGTAEAHKPHNWCPGQPMNYPTGPGPGYSWDMNICHTWFWVPVGGMTQKHTRSPLASKT